MSVAQMRKELKRFNGRVWADNVDKMPDNQVVAVFRRYQSKGLIK